jgi:hypothetical protein
VEAAGAAGVASSCPAPLQAKANKVIKTSPYIASRRPLNATVAIFPSANHAAWHERFHTTLLTALTAC